MYSTGSLRFRFGGAEGARTLYLLLAKQALSQVSYSPKKEALILYKGLLGISIQIFTFLNCPVMSSLLSREKRR